MKRFQLVILTILIALAFLSNGVNAKDQNKTKDKDYRTLRPWGKPDVDMKERVAFLIWADKEKDTWFFRWTAGGKQHKFKGVITPMNGHFSNVQLHGFEWKNDSISIDGHRIAFDGSVGKGKDGFDFQLSNSAIGIRVEVSIDGSPMVEKIWVGKKNRQPTSIPFEVVK